MAAPRTRRPTLTLFCGLPGSGKTTLARRLEAAGAGVRLCTDEWQAALGVPHSDLELHEALQRTLYDHALRLLSQGVDVVLEDGLWMAAERAEKLADARARGARVVLHVLEVPLPELERRLAERDRRGDPTTHPVPPSCLQWAAGLFEPPTPQELSRFDEVHHHRA